MEQPETEGINQSVIALLQQHQMMINKIVDEARGKRLFIESTSGNVHECLVRILNLDESRSSKILKSDFEYQITDNRWIILGLVMDQMPPVFYMIPLTVFRTPNNWFVDNEQPSRLNHMSNWEIKIYLRAMPELSRYLMVSTLAGIK